MIRVKNKEEIKILREGGEILANVLDLISKEIFPGVKSADLEEYACDLIKKAGGWPSFKYYKMFDGSVYPTALCMSLNDEIVHCPSLPPRVFDEGGIVGIDIGLEFPIDERYKTINKYSKYGGYFTDTARTVAIGKISEEAKQLLAVTEASLYQGIDKVKPNNTINDIGSAIQECVEKHGYSIVRSLVGHGVGHFVHEDPQIPNYKIKGTGFKNVVLKPGMVIAIEPMVNIGGYEIKSGDDDFTIKTADGSLSAHFEHTVLVTEDGFEILTEL
jgi:methionyl aminopeptidase